MGAVTTSEDRPVPAAAGKGPLLQRDYWAIIEGCRMSPPEIGTLLRDHFCDLAPNEWVRFRRPGRGCGPLEVGDDLEVYIRWAGTFGVRVIHVDDNSLTVGTLPGHPEAGRITFGAYRHERGDVVFHIRSIARSSSSLRHMGFVVLGRPMQTKAWTDLVAHVAATAGEGVEDFVYEETRRRDDDDDAANDDRGPTFVARGS